MNRVCSFVLVWLLLQGVASPRSALAVRLDGLDCDQNSQIPPARCAAWKEKNPDGRWWCHWDTDEGRITAVLGHHGEPSSPGLDLTQITRESARSDQATRQLLEVYARQQIREYEPVFGLEPHGYELRLTGFDRRPAGVKRTLQSDGSVLEEPLPAVSILRLQQIVKQHRLDGATIELSVDDENRLVSIFSSFVVDVPPNLPNHKLTAEEATAIGLEEISPTVTLGPEDAASAEPTYSIIGGEVVPTYQVFVSLDEPLMDSRVVVHGRTGNVLESIDEVSRHGVGDLSFSTNGTGRVFPRFPEHGTVADFIGDQEDVRLRHIQTPEPGEPYRLIGYFLYIDNREQLGWTNENEPRFVLPFDFLGIEIDHEPGNGSGPEPTSTPPDPLGRDARGARTCTANLKPELGQFPPDALRYDANAVWSSRLDEVSAYHHIDSAAHYFENRFGHELGHHNNTTANPRIRTIVNFHGQSETNGYFSVHKGDCYGGCTYKPSIRFTGGGCWECLVDGNNAQFFPPLETVSHVVDYYSRLDMSRNRDFAWHEFTHAVQWDITSTTNKDFGNAWKEGVADFFPASAFDDQVYSPWFGTRRLDPDYVVSGVTIEEDLLYPASVESGRITTEEHSLGKVWSNFLWDLRKRAELMASDVDTDDVSVQSVEDLQFEAFARTPEHIGSFRVALDRLLDSDHAVTGKRLSYEIVASAARHGIKLRDAIAAVEPSRFALIAGVDTSLTFTIYAGTNDQVFLEVTTEPALLGSGIVGDPRYVLRACTFPSCTTDPSVVTGLAGGIAIPVGDDSRNRRKVFTISDPAVFDGFLAGSSAPKALFYRATTLTMDNPLTPDNESSPEINSDIPGAGATVLHPDLPAVFLLPPGTDPGCLVCSVGLTGSPTPALPIVLFLTLPLMVVVVRRRGA